MHGQVPDAYICHAAFANVCGQTPDAYIHLAVFANVFSFESTHERRAGRAYICEPLRLTF